MPFVSFRKRLAELVDFTHRTAISSLRRASLCLLVPESLFRIKSTISSLLEIYCWEISISPSGSLILLHFQHEASNLHNLYHWHAYSQSGNRLDMSKGAHKGQAYRITSTKAHARKKCYLSKFWEILWSFKIWKKSSQHEQERDTFRVMFQITFNISATMVAQITIFTANLWIWGFQLTVAI